jgi:hypothetical protein
MIICLLAVGLALAPAPAPVPVPAGSLEAHVSELERELEKLQLRAAADDDDEDAAPARVPAAPPASPNVFNPTLTVVGNGLFRYDDRPVLAGDGGPDGDARADKTFDVREVELDLRAAVDPFADAVVIVSLHAEVPGGDLGVELEEGYVTLKSLPLPILDVPPLGLKLKVGRMRTDVGRMNRLHLHDLPQVDRPLALEELYGEEGQMASGLAAQLFLPSFDEDSAVELTAELLAGGGAPVTDGSPRDPAVIGHLRWFRPFGAHSVDLALILHYGRTALDRAAVTTSADLLYKWKPLRGGEFRSFVMGGQVLYTLRDALVDETTGATERMRPLGFYGFAQVQLTRGTYLGGRWDDAATLTDDSLRRRAVSAYLTWYPSEFLRFRVGYQHRVSDLAEEDGRDSAFGELSFVFGAHPPHPYWVNR